MQSYARAKVRQRIAAAVLAALIRIVARERH